MARIYWSVLTGTWQDRTIKETGQPATTAQRLYDVLFNLSIRGSAWLTRNVSMKIQYTALCCLLVLLIAGCAHNPKVPYRGAKLSERYTIAQLDSAVATEEALITSAAALAGREENSQKDVPFFNHPRRYPTRAEWVRMKSLAQAGDEICRFRGRAR